MTTSISTCSGRSIRRSSATFKMTTDSVNEYRALEATRFGVQLGFRHPLSRRCADRPAVRHLARHLLRQPAGLADPPPDRRRQAGLARQSQCPRAGAQGRGRSRRLVRDLQHDDGAAADPAGGAPEGERTDRQPAPFYRSGALRRDRGRHRHRRSRADHHRQSHRRSAFSAPGPHPWKAGRSPTCCRSSARRRRRARQRSLRVSRPDRCQGRRPRANHQRPGDDRGFDRSGRTAMSSPSTTSPTW